MFTSKALIIEGSYQLTESKVRRTSVLVFVSVRPPSRSQMAPCTFPPFFRTTAGGSLTSTNFTLRRRREESSRTVACVESILAFLRLVPIKY